MKIVFNKWVMRAITAALIYFAALGNGGAYNVLLAMHWLLFFLAILFAGLSLLILVFSDENAKDKISQLQKREKVGNYIWCGAKFCAFAYFGWWAILLPFVTGTLMHFIIVEIFNNKKEEQV